LSFLNINPQQSHLFSIKIGVKGRREQDNTKEIKIPRKERGSTTHEGDVS